jgi:excisionase family DNA binding protein
VRDTRVTTPVVSASTPTLDAREYLSVAELATYSGLSVRTLKRYLAQPPQDALPCLRVGRRVLVKKSSFDDWIARFTSCGPPRLVEIMERMGMLPQSR